WPLCCPFSSGSTGAWSSGPERARTEAHRAKDRRPIQRQLQRSIGAAGTARAARAARGTPRTRTARAARVALAARAARPARGTPWTRTALAARATHGTPWTRTALAARPARGTPWTRRIRSSATGRTTLPRPGPERAGRASIWACPPSGRVSIGAGRPSRPAAHGGRSPIRHSLHPVDTPVHDPTGKVPIEWIHAEGAGEGWRGWGLATEGRAHGYTGGGRMGIRGLGSGVYDDGPAPLRG